MLPLQLKIQETEWRKEMMNEESSLERSNSFRLIIDFLPTTGSSIYQRILKAPRVGELVNALHLWEISEELREQIETRTGFKLYFLDIKDEFRHDPPLFECMLELYDKTDNCFVVGDKRLQMDLRDVHYISGLPVDGEPIGFDPKDVDVDDLIKKSFNLPEVPGNLKIGNRIHLKSLREHFGEGEKETELLGLNKDAYIRAYLLYYIGTVVLPATSNGLVSSEYLKHLEDIEGVGKCAWGAAALCRFYRHLNSNTMKFNILASTFMVFCYLHIPIFLEEYGIWTKFSDQRIENRFPLIVGWSQRLFRSTRVVPYRNFLKRLEGQVNITWNPYGEVRDLPVLRRTLCSTVLTDVLGNAKYEPQKWPMKLGSVLTYHDHIPNLPDLNDFNACAKAWKERIELTEVPLGNDERQVNEVPPELVEPHEDVESEEVNRVPPEISEAHDDQEIEISAPQAEVDEVPLENVAPQENDESVLEGDNEDDDRVTDEQVRESNNENFSMHSSPMRFPASQSTSDHTSHQGVDEVPSETVGPRVIDEQGWEGNNEHDSMHSPPMGSPVFRPTIDPISPQGPRHIDCPLVCKTRRGDKYWMGGLHLHFDVHIHRALGALVG